MSVDKNGKKYLFLCERGMCGEFDLDKLRINKNIREDEDDTALVCPECGGCTWYIVYADDNEYEEERNKP